MTVEQTAALRAASAEAARRMAVSARARYGEIMAEALEHQMGRAIAPRRLEFDEDASVSPEAHTALGQWGTEKIATELLQADAIVRGDPDVGVEVEAIEAGPAGGPGR